MTFIIHFKDGHRETYNKRNRILWRLKGMVGFPFEEGVLTPLENDRLNTAFGIIRGVIQDSVSNRGRGHKEDL